MFEVLSNIKSWGLSTKLKRVGEEKIKWRLGNIVFDLLVILL